MSPRVPSLLLVLSALSLSSLSACGGHTQLHVTKPVAAPIAAPSVGIITTGNGAKESRAADRFRDVLGGRLEKAGVFREVSTDGDVVLNCRVTHLSTGEENERKLTLKGKAEVTVEVRITKPDGQLLGHVTVTSTTTRKNDEDNPSLRVLQQAADELVEYLKAHRAAKGAKPSEDEGDADEGEDEGEQDASDEGEPTSEGDGSGEAPEDDATDSSEGAKPKGDATDKSAKPKAGPPKAE